jgi:hypothetical protein
MAEPYENIVEDPSYNRLLNTCHKIAQNKSKIFLNYNSKIKFNNYKKILILKT